MATWQRMLSCLEQTTKTGTLACKGPRRASPRPFRRVDTPKESTKNRVPVDRRRNQCFRCVFLGPDLLLQPVEQLYETAVDIVAKFLAVFVECEFGEVVTYRKNPTVVCLVSFSVTGPNVDTPSAGFGMLSLAGPVLLQERF